MTNIAEILKDAPKGTKLYSPICGECELEEVKIDDTYPIKVHFRTEEGYETQIFNPYGQSFASGEVVIFPSEDNRDWSKFNPFASVNYPVGTVLKCRATGSLWIRCKYGDVKNGGTGCVGGAYDEASEKERRIFLKELSDRGYEWDEKEGNVKKKKKEYTFTPFQKVLGRDDDTWKWIPDFYGFYSEEEGLYQCVGTTWCQVIPFEGNEHLLGTTNKPE